MISEGDTLWYVPDRENTRGADSFAVTVGKVGRRWAVIRKEGWTYDFGRIDKETLCADGGAYTSPGRCWPSQSAYEAHIGKQKTWEKLQRKLAATWVCPDFVTSEDIDRIAAIMRVTL